MNTATATIKWNELVVLDGETMEPVTGEIVTEKLAEFRRSDSMSQFYFAPLPGQDADEAWACGPQSADEVDWTGFPIN